MFTRRSSLIDKTRNLPGLSGHGIGLGVVNPTELDSNPRRPALEAACKLSILQPNSDKN